MPYRSEAAFTRSLTTLLKYHETMIQRIETGTTGLGVPDMWTHSGVNELWIEVKNDRKQSVYARTFHVPWRKGQQAWHYLYHRHTKRFVLTIMAVSDGYVMIPLAKRYVGNKVPCDDCFIVTELHDCWGVIKHYMEEV